MIEYWIPFLVLTAAVFLFFKGQQAIRSSSYRNGTKALWNLILLSVFCLVFVCSFSSLQPKERLALQIAATAFLLCSAAFKSIILWRSLNAKNEYYHRLAAGIISIGLLLIIGLFLKQVAEIVPLLTHKGITLSWNILGLQLGAALLPALFLSRAVEIVQKKALKQRREHIFKE